MSDTAESGHVTVRAVDGSAKPVIGNLLQLYLYDMAAAFQTPIGPRGLYDHDILQDCWDHPYLIHVGDEIAGFALITTQCTIRDRSPCWYIAEFCVLRPFRRQGVGQTALRRLLAQHPGAWEITWFDGNAPAAAFWPKAIPGAERATHHITAHGRDWTSVAFTSPGA